MTDGKSEWQKANRELIAEQRQHLGDPPTAEELHAYFTGGLSEAEEERVRDLIVAYPELARMYLEPAPEAPRPGDPDYESEAQLLAELQALQRRLQPRPEAQRGRVSFRQMPTAIAAALALVFFGLFVQAEMRARDYARESRLPRILGEPQSLDSEGTRGAATPVMLSRDGDVYFLEPQLGRDVRYPHYRVELREKGRDSLWMDSRMQPDHRHRFQLVIPHALLHEGQTYELRVSGLDGRTAHLVASYELSVPAE